MAVKFAKGRREDVQILLKEVESVKAEAKSSGSSDGGFRYRQDDKEFVFASGADAELLRTDIPQVMWRFLDFSQKTPPTLCQAWISKILMSCLFEDGAIDIDRFIGELSAKERSYLSKRNREYIIISRISFKTGSSIEDVHLGDVTFSFSDNVNDEFAINHDKHRRALRMRTDVKDFMWIQARFRAKCPFGAHAYYRKTLHRLMGAWGVISKQSRQIGFGFMEQKLDQLLAVGPVATVHNVDGSLASSTCWYEIHFDPDRKPISDETYIESVQKRGNNILGSIDALESTKMKSFIQDVFSLYGEAVIAHSPSDRFLGMWRMLEKASCVGAGESHSKIVDRISSLFKGDRMFMKTILQYLRISRNIAVHDGDDTNNTSSMWYLDGICKDLIHRMLKYCSRFSTLDEYIAFLDAPTDPKVIDRKKRTLELAKELKT